MRKSELGIRDWAWLESCIGEEEEVPAMGLQAEALLQGQC